MPESVSRQSESLLECGHFVNLEFSCF